MMILEKYILFSLLVTDNLNYVNPCSKADDLGEEARAMGTQRGSPGLDGQFQPALTVDECDSSVPGCYQLEGC